MARKLLMDRNVEIHNTDALEIIRAYKDNSEVQFLLDPPYSWDMRTTTEGYYHELEMFDHITLLNEITDMKASAVLCGYHCPYDDLYDRFLPLWESTLLKEVAKPSGNSKGKAGNRAQEWVWMNHMEVRT